MAGRILAGSVAFVAASCRAPSAAVPAASTPAASDGSAVATAGRLHELLLEAARAMAATVDAVGVTAASPGDAGRLPELRKLLFQRQRSRQERRGASAASSGVPRGGNGVDGAAVGGVIQQTQGNGAAAGLQLAGSVPTGQAETSGSIAELACPWSWDVTQPLTLLSDGTPVGEVAARLPSSPPSFLVGGVH